MPIVRLAPQAGAQEKFMASSADICLYGGSAGGGKSFALLLEPLRHINNPAFNATIFRRSYTQITSAGGLWDTSYQIYGLVKGAAACKTPKFHWTFPSGATVHFAHLTRNEDCQAWQGSQLNMIGFDEITHFSRYQFFYMLSRNRSASGIAPYVRATCNPDADSWVAEFIAWWIDQETGYPIPERSGVVRWMIHQNDNLMWFDTKEEAMIWARDNGTPENELEYAAKSVTFIASTIYDNKALLENDPQYLANLRNLTYVEQERLLKGNWKIRNNGGLMFKRSQIELIDIKDFNRGMVTSYVRAWDLAATAEDGKGEPAYTAGVLVASMNDGTFVILDVLNQRLSAGEVLTTITNTAISDRNKYGYCRTRIPQDPGQAGKSQSEYFIKQLAGKGFDCVARLESGNKEHRATPVAALWQHHFVKVVAADWNEMYFSQLEGFPQGKFKDMVDATSSAFDETSNYMGFNIDSLL